MCGIVGYKGKREAYKIILDSLKTLEYRGYDSWGVAVIGNPSISVVKEVGMISDADSLINNTKITKGTTGVGHTRWATHGNVTEANSHPHLSTDGKIAVVHNGIIENYQSLRGELKKKGYVFKSDTDSEVIPYLIEDFLKSETGISFEDAFRKTLYLLEGTYAIVAIDKDSETMLCVRKDSPIVIGVGDGEYFIASDAPAFIEHTKNVIFLENDELVAFNGDMKIIDLVTGKKLSKKPQVIDWDVEQAKKGEFKHYMLKEISEQKETINKAIHQDNKVIQDIADAINESYGTFFIASGSSYHAALSASYTFSRIAKKHINVVDASEFPNYEHFLTPQTLMITVSQSGETADVLDAVKVAKKKGVKIISIVNVMGSSLMRNSNYSLLMNVGPEICVLSTKSYTSQLSILTLLAYASVGKLDEGKALLKCVANHVGELTDPKVLLDTVEVASYLKDKEHLYVIGRGQSYPTALEAALKIKEVSYIHAEGFAGGSLKHGPIALIEKGTPCIVFAPNDETKKEVLSNAMEIKSRGGYIIGVSDMDNEIFDYFIKVPDVGHASPICDIIPIQVLSYYLAILRGCNPDRPRNLAKSVTVK
ncbi:MAG: glutamine--fructose-6-phosphate transaminase (isomerizing) [DPANN group archaeon]|nr:glutamine--fructose-6-phosphate transaminase (isomerizing) [DPANN group archaeon]